MKQDIKQILCKVRTIFSRTARTNSEEGQLLVWSILLTAFGSFVIIGLLSYVTVSIKVTSNALESAEEYYTAGAGVKAVIADLVQGVDILDVGYTKPTVTLNNYSANVSISAANPDSGPSVQYRYFDPRASGNLTPLASGNRYAFQIDNVITQSDFQVNWAFTPADKSWELNLYQGAGTGGELVATNNGTASPGYLSVDGGLIAGGTYTIEFHNTSGSATNSAAFNSEGDSEYTWIYTKAKKDYILRATAADITVVAYVRQEPGPTVSPNAAPTVTIMSWQAPAITP